ncbi:1-(5-phosphoribosyl)-5-[(5-phosphoribosylamino)methylideneamino]imidazole-4-carboxamide isomerase [Melioribacteraceae bacterium 4301-Me]|uniref:1-(5-phosphoribosyl)-5-[(5- phosphoribosylamino)methylideneamino]imidazole-4- carboxamide isomerase n=1 Tax=Pyranulibacter aquaticus TaxID=3163344 RepID=UPI0035987350
MLTIPAVDIYNGKVVRLLKGDFNQIKIYGDNPIEIIQKFEQHLFPWVHIVDLVASVSGNITTINLLKEIKKSSKLRIQFGGGIKNFLQAELLIKEGIDKIIVGSMSVLNKDDFEKTVIKFGAESIVVALDVKNEMVLIKGWTKESNISIWDHLNYCISLGIKYYLCTDVLKDGTLQGPHIEFYKKIMSSYPQIKLIASGGISSVDDLLALKKINIYASVVGKAIYENKISLKELSKFVS